MKIEVNLEKRYVFGLLLVGLVILGIAGVIAYSSAGTGGNPVVFGHSVDEMDWSKTIPGNLSVNGLCIGTDCRTSWPVAGSNGVNLLAGSGIIFTSEAGGMRINSTATGESPSSQWTTSGSNINYNAGNVSTTNYVKTAGVCIGSNCMTTVRAKVIYEVNYTHCVDYGSLKLSPTCKTTKECRCGAGVLNTYCYYKCNGQCASSSADASTCNNLLVGYLVK